MMVSKNIEQLVKTKYGDLDSAKEMVAAEKARQEKFVKMMFIIILSFFAFVIFVVFAYMLRITFIRKKLTKTYLTKELVVMLY